MINRENLGEEFHTALRKCCSSEPTTIAYLVIHRMEKSWGVALDLLYHHVKDAKSAAECSSILLELAARTHGLSFMGMPDALCSAYQDLPAKAQENFDILMCAFRMFSKDDWESAFSFSFPELDA